MHKAAPPARRVLLLTSGESVARIDAVSRAVAPGAEVVRAQTLPSSLQFDAVVLDGPQASLTAADAEALGAFAAAGGRILALDAASADDSPLNRLLGARAGEACPAGEYFVTVLDGDDASVARLPLEFPVVDSFAPLTLAGDAKALLAVNVHFKDRVVLAQSLRGPGSITISSLGATDTALENPSLQSILRRTLLPRAEMPPRTLGVAIVGYGPLGGMGYVHGHAIGHTPGLELTAIVDTNEQRLEAAHEIFPAARLYHSVDDVLGDEAVDIAFVATPPSSHVPVSLKLLEAGKHVVCEKPLCFTVAEADALIDAALSRGLALTVSQNRRWDRDYLTIRRLIESGRLGDVFNVETFVGSFEHPCREWHSEASVSGGAEFDWGAHYIDWILQLYGSPPASVVAHSHKRVWHDVTNMDQVRVHMTWEDGREAEFVHSDVAAVRRPKFYVQGTKGTLVGQYRPLVSEHIDAAMGYVRDEMHHAEAPADLTFVAYEPLGGGLHEEKLTLVTREPYSFYRNLADHLLLDDQPLAVDYRDTRALIGVLEAAHRSAEQHGRPMTPA